MCHIQFGSGTMSTVTTANLTETQLFPDEFPNLISAARFFTLALRVHNFSL